MIAENISNLSEKMPHNVTLVAVSKTKPPELLMEAYNAGQRHFGENKVQELVTKQETLPSDIKWHFIGHLQRNKVKYIAAFTHLIHGVDSLKLLKEVNKQGVKHNRVIKVLLQFHIAEEESKFGLDLSEAKELLNSESFAGLTNIRIDGVMGMATFTDNRNQIKNEFKSLKKIFDDLKNDHFNQSENFTILSMGMSGDYELAIEEGSTMVRIGSTIFGARNKPT